MVHRLRNLRNLGQPLQSEVLLPRHHASDSRELPELLSFRRSQWICFEERDDSTTQVIKAQDGVRDQIFAMIVVSAVSVQRAAAKEVSNQLENIRTAFTLDNRESRLYLPSDLIFRIAIDRSAETTFTVDEADDPELDSWSFLLIVRTRRIVTAHVAT